MERWSAGSAGSLRSCSGSAGPSASAVRRALAAGLPTPGGCGQIREIAGNTRDGSIAQTLLATGTPLTLPDPATGVETPEQHADLTQ